MNELDLNSSKKDISVVIPCFNTPPEYLQEAIESVKKYKGQFSYQVIIVNDGSTDESTLQHLRNLEDPGIQVIDQENKGLAGARNTGVFNTTSEFVLFLDSDDRIKPGYIEQGIEILKANPKTGVVYANAEAFGDNSRTNFAALPFDLTSLFLQNHVPSCVIMRRKILEDIGGFDEKLRKYEDWECWIRVHKAGWQFELLKEPMFEYRIHQNSLLGKSGEEEFKKAIEYIFTKHWDLVYQQYHYLYGQQVIYKNDQKKPLRSFLKYAGKFLRK